ncbi:MAG: tRNA pseudouridine(38-40) synthase TruA [Pseudomonadota bacterium]
MTYIKPGYRRYRITIEYKGDSFYGWQRQKLTPTVQAEIEAALLTIVREKVNIHGAGRTDAGVHAYAQVAHFDVPHELHCDHTMLGINYFLKGKGAVVTSLEPTFPDFHARFSALSRSYNYFILNRRPASILQYEHAWHIMKPLNHELMHEAAQLLVGHHDFSAFRDSECQAQNPMRRLDVFDITSEGDIIKAYLKSRAFLHHQVRIMMGTLKWVGDGRIKPTDVLDILASRQRKRAGQTAPPHALFFLGAEYPEKYKSFFG